MKASKLPKMTAIEVESAVADFFNFRTNLIVPNVSWGLFDDHHEADLVVLHPSGFADEVEIKVTAADIKADLAKRSRAHKEAGCREIRRLFFAVPYWLADNPNIPAFAGIISIGGPHGTQIVRAAKINRKASKLDDQKRAKLAHLGCMRIWTLKRHEKARLIKLRKDAEAACKQRGLTLNIGDLAKTCSRNLLPQ